MHHKVFSGSSKIESYILTALLAKRLSSWLKKSKHYTSKVSTERIIARRGLFHFARIASYFWRKNDNWSSSTEILDQINTLDKKIETIYPIFEKAIQVMLNVIKSSEYKEDPERGLKASNIDRAIDKALYKGIK